MLVPCYKRQDYRSSHNTKCYNQNTKSPGIDSFTIQKMNEACRGFSVGTSCHWMQRPLLSGVWTWKIECSPEKWRRSSIGSRLFPNRSASSRSFYGPLPCYSSGWYHDTSCGLLNSLQVRGKLYCEVSIILMNFANGKFCPSFLSHSNHQWFHQKDNHSCAGLQCRGKG